MAGDLAAVTAATHQLLEHVHGTVYFLTALIQRAGSDATELHAKAVFSSWTKLMKAIDDWEAVAGPLGSAHRIRLRSAALFADLASVNAPLTANTACAHECAHALADELAGMISTPVLIYKLYVSPPQGRQLNFADVDAVTITLTAHSYQEQEVINRLKVVRTVARHLVPLVSQEEARVRVGERDHAHSTSTLPAITGPEAMVNVSLDRAEPPSRGRTPKEIAVVETEDEDEDIPPTVDELRPYLDQQSVDLIEKLGGIGSALHGSLVTAAEGRLGLKNLDIAVPEDVRRVFDALGESRALLEKCEEHDELAGYHLRIVVGDRIRSERAVKFLNPSRDFVFRIRLHARDLLGLIEQSTNWLAAAAIRHGMLAAGGGVR